MHTVLELLRRIKTFLSTRIAISFTAHPFHAKTTVRIPGSDVMHHCRVKIKLTPIFQVVDTANVLALGASWAN